MKLLAEIFRSEGLNIKDRAVTRRAVRAIILEQDKLFMVYSKKNGDYKFPGGGVKKGEAHKEALNREIREETGVNLAEIGTEFGKVIEYDRSIDAAYEVFKMTSSYYMCKIGDEVVEQQLEPYEKDLGFTACWVNLAEALNTNQALLLGQNTGLPRWVRRETFVLEQIQNKWVDKK
jgi:8-oxo-dGTP pyrophosphatase MutT (NUDIX family)